MTTTDIRTDLSLTVERVIKAPAEKLFNAWLDPEMLKKFMLPGPDMSLPKADVDAREGGRFDLIMRSGDEDLPHGGTYKTIAPHTKIVFSWESAWSPAESEVTLDFTPEGDSTRVTLTHQTFFDEEKRDNHQAGWGAILEVLDQVAA
jgi:uncharacterized protein YndB with AHSA1/START domain